MPRKGIIIVASIDNEEAPIAESSTKRDPQSQMRSALALATCVVACYGAAFVGSALTSPTIAGWYETLIKPPFTPPSWLFGPVWTVLYLAMAIAGWLVWRRKGLTGATLPLALFGGQLLLNALWSVLFFGLREPGVALIEILLLWAVILATTLSFRSVSRTASWLLTPYLAWVTFAVALNLEIWRLNS
jgi:translocator protein